MEYPEMKRTLSLFAVVVLALTPFSIGATDSPATLDSWQRDLLAWREKRAANLQTPEGWLSLIGLEWLKEGDNNVGSAADNKIQIAKAPAHLAVVRLEKGGALRLLPPGSGFPKELLVDSHAAQEQALLSDDSPNRSKLSLGGLSIIVIHRDELMLCGSRTLRRRLELDFTGCAGMRRIPRIACTPSGSRTILRR